MERLFEHMGSDELLLYSTDYPHAQFDGASVYPAGIDGALRDKIGGANVLSTYPRLREATP